MTRFWRINFEKMNGLFFHITVKICFQKWFETVRINQKLLYLYILWKKAFWRENNEKWRNCSGSSIKWQYPQYTNKKNFNFNVMCSVFQTISLEHESIYFRIAPFSLKFSRKLASFTNIKAINCLKCKNKISKSCEKKKNIKNSVFNIH